MNNKVKELLKILDFSSDILSSINSLTFECIKVYHNPIFKRPDTEFYLNRQNIPFSNYKKNYFNEHKTNVMSFSKLRKWYTHKKRN